MALSEDAVRDIGTNSAKATLDELRGFIQDQVSDEKLAHLRYQEAAFNALTLGKAEVSKTLSSIANDEAKHLAWLQDMDASLSGGAVEYKSPISENGCGTPEVLTDKGEPEKIVKCNCPIPLKPMSKWIAEKNQEGCKPCVLTPVVQWYWEELKERGYTDHAKRIESLAEKLDEDNPEQIKGLCQELDRIKQEVPESVSERLKDFDCEVQSVDLIGLEKEVQSGA